MGTGTGTGEFDSSGEATVDTSEITALRLRVSELERANLERDKAIAERDQAIAALKEEVSLLKQADTERQRLVAVVESCLDFIALASVDEVTTYINESGRRMVGLDDMEHAQRTVVTDYFAPEDADYVVNHILPEVMRVGQWQGDFRFRHFKTGQLIPVHYSLFRINDKSTGEFIGVGTVTRDITERKKAEEAQAQLKDEIIRMQAAALAELSTPLIPITDEVVVMPLIGTVDSKRADQAMETLLRGVIAHHAQTVILDITGVSSVDANVADALMRAAKAVRLLGAETVLTGISPRVAQTLVGLGIDLAGTITRSTLQSGIAWATSENRSPSTS